MLLFAGESLLVRLMKHPLGVTFNAWLQYYRYVAGASPRVRKWSGNTWPKMKREVHLPKFLNRWVSRIMRQVRKGSGNTWLSSSTGTSVLVLATLCQNASAEWEAAGPCTTRMKCNPTLRVPEYLIHYRLPPRHVLRSSRTSGRHYQHVLSGGTSWLLRSGEKDSRLAPTARSTRLHVRSQIIYMYRSTSTGNVFVHTPISNVVRLPAPVGFSLLERKERGGGL